MDLVHFISQRFIQHMKHKDISNFQLIQVGQQGGGGEAAMARDDAVGAGTAHRQGRTFNMPHRHLQHLIAGAVIHGQRYVNAGDLQISHNAVTGDVQQLLIPLLVFFTWFKPAGCLQEGSVVRPGLFPKLIVSVIVQLCHGFHVGSNGLGLMHGVPIVSHSWIQQQGQPCKKYRQ